MDTKELYYESDTRKHKQIVAVKHDASKLDEPERSAYIDPVFAFNNEDVPYGSERYKDLVAQLGDGLKHHESTNDHHIGFFVPYSGQTLKDPVLCLDLIVLIEMCCDWIAAASRRGNEPGLALKELVKKYPMDEHLQQVIRNTISVIETAFKTGGSGA